jgi:hypothetical protein
MPSKINLCANIAKKRLLTNFFKKSLIKNANLLRKDLTANLLRKGLIENSGINFKRLIPKPYRRDQPAQRLVVNRRNGCGPTVADNIWKDKSFLPKPTGLEPILKVRRGYSSVRSTSSYSRFSVSSLLRREETCSSTETTRDDRP